MKSGSADEAILEAATQINHVSLAAFEISTVAAFDAVDALERIRIIRGGKCNLDLECNFFNNWSVACSISGM